MRMWLPAMLLTLGGCASTGGPADHAKPLVYAPSPRLVDPSRYEQYASFSPDGREYYLSVANREWWYLGVLRSVREGDGWSPFAPLPFLWGHGQDGGEPFVSHDARELYFVSSRAGSRPGETDIYRARRSGKDWGEPVALAAPVNSKESEWHPTLSSRGTLFFASERAGGHLKADIYSARRNGDGSFSAVAALPAPINLPGANDSDPFIARDESYLIFHSDRPGGHGAHDLYIAFPDGAGNWSAPLNLGEEINSAGWEMGPHVTPDGRLLFTRRDKIVTDTPSRIHAVGSAFLKRLRALNARDRQSLRSQMLR
jgi:hypothetical protein